MQQNDQISIDKYVDHYIKLPKNLDNDWNLEQLRALFNRDIHKKKLYFLMRRYLKNNKKNLDQNALDFLFWSNLIDKFQYLYKTEQIQKYLETNPQYIKIAARVYGSKLSIKQQINNKLKADFFIDTKNKQKTAFTYDQSIAQLFTQDEVYELIKNALRLLKRSENNIDTLNTIITQTKSIDLSQIIATIEESLKEIMSENAVNVLNQAYSHLHQPNAIQSSIKHVSNLISTTHDENKKYLYLTLIQGLIKSLQNIPDKVDNSQLIVDLISNNASLFKNDQQLIQLYPLIKSLISYDIQLNNHALYKKLLAGNKYQSTFVSFLFLAYIQKHQNVDHDIADSIFKLALQPNLKNFAKVVTQTLMFLSSFNFILLFLQYCEEDAQANLVNSIHKALTSTTDTIFSPKSHLCKLPYLSSISPVEAQLLGDSLLLTYALYFDDFQDQINFGYIGTFITLILTASYRFKFDLIQPILEKTDNGVSIFISQLYKVLRAYLYKIDWDRSFDKINSFLSKTTKYVEQDFDQVAYTLAHPQLSKKLIQKLKKMNINELAGKHTSVYFFLNENSQEAVQRYSQFLIDQGMRDELVIAEVLDYENMDKVNSLDEVDQKKKDYEVEVLDCGEDMKEMGIKCMSFKVQEDYDEEMVHVGKSKKNKQIMMDENEVKIQMKKKHIHKMEQYYSKCMQWLIGFAKTNNVENRKWFMLEYFNKLAQFGRDANFRMPLYRFCVQYFQKYDLTIDFKYGLSDFVISMQSDNITQNSIKVIQRFQNHILNKKIQDESLLLLVNSWQEFILRKNDFEFKNKELAMQFILKYHQESELFREKYMQNYFEIIVNNINICGHIKICYDVVHMLLQTKQNKEVYYLQMFKDILNLVPEAQDLCLKIVDPKVLPIEIDFYLKLRILEQDELVKQLPPFQEYVKSIDDWQLDKFVEGHSKEQVEFAIRILKEQLTCKWDIVTSKVFDAATKFYSKLSDESLLFFPYFLRVCNEKLPQNMIQKLIDLIINKYASTGQGLLVQESLDAGIEILKFWGDQLHKQLLPVLEKYMDDKNKQENKAICAVIYLGILSPYLKNSNDLQHKLLALFQISKQPTQINLAKALPNLLTFFPDTLNLIMGKMQENRKTTNQQAIRGNAYLIAGLIRAIGISVLEKTQILNSLEPGVGEKKEPLENKLQVLLTLEALVEILGRTLEPNLIQVMQLLMVYFGDGKDDIRQLAIGVARVLMQKLTGYGVKIILPHLLKGIDESKSWRGKIANIWALGNMAYCAPKQLSTHLPTIVNTIAKAISDTHPQVRQAANESLQTIGSTIQSPEISSIADILIKALSNPFDENRKGLDAILSTNFGHYIDAPALSLLIPIIDYALKSQESEQKQLACKLLCSIPMLIKNKDDLVPYLDMVVNGLEVAISDPLLEVRYFGAKAIGSISNKIEIENSEKYFGFVWNSLDMNLREIKRSGAANSLAEIICNQSSEYFESQMQLAYDKTRDEKQYVKQGYIEIFEHIPNILLEEFDPYVQDVIDNIQEFMCHEIDEIKNTALKVMKNLVQKYGVLQNELLYATINNNMMDKQWKKRNSALILAGEMLEIAQPIMKKQLENPALEEKINMDLYIENLMLIYSMRQDEAEDVRKNATQIWKDYIDNTPRWVKRGLRHLVTVLCKIIVPLPTLGLNTIQNFCQKYGDSHLSSFLEYIELILLEKVDLTMVQGAYSLLKALHEYTEIETLQKYKNEVLKIQKQFILSSDTSIKKQLFESIGVIVKRLKSISLLQELLTDYLDQLQDNEIDENNKLYESYLEIFTYLCELDNQLILQYMVKILVTVEIKQYQIDALTNNAQYIAKYIYPTYMDILFKQLQQSIQQYSIVNKQIQYSQFASSLLYCIQQISINLSEEFIAIFLTDIYRVLDYPDQSFQFNYYSLQLIYYFVTNTAQPYQSNNREIMPRIVPFLFQLPCSLQINDILATIANQILFNINNTLDKDQHHLNMTYIHTAFFNRYPQSTQIPGLTSFDPYVDMLIDTFVYGEDEVYQQAVQFITLVLDYATPQPQQILKIVGALIRLLNYKNTTKTPALKILYTAYEKQFLYHHFASQLQVTYLKLIVPIQQEKCGLKQLAKNYAKLFIHHPKKDLSLNELFNYAGQAQTQQIKEGSFKIIKTIIKHCIKIQPQVFSTALLERIFVLTKQYYSIQSLTPYLTQQLVTILALTYSYASKSRKDQLQSQLNQASDQFLLLLAFKRFMSYPEDDINLQLLQHIKNEEDTFLISQILRGINKCNLNITKDQVKEYLGQDKIYNSLEIQNAMSILK